MGELHVLDHPLLKHKLTVIRDKNTKFKDAAYSPNPSTPDAYMPLNGVKVILKKDGVQIAEYTTDNYITAHSCSAEKRVTPSLKRAEKR